MNFIEKLQNKPKKTRIMILWLASGLIMTIIIVFWIFSFSLNTNKQNAKDAINKTELPSLFETIKNDISAVKQNVTASLREIKDQTNLEDLQELNEGQE